MVASRTAAENAAVGVSTGGGGQQSTRVEAGVTRAVSGSGQRRRVPVAWELVLDGEAPTTKVMRPTNEVERERERERGGGRERGRDRGWERETATAPFSNS